MDIYVPRKEGYEEKKKKKLLLVGVCACAVIMYEF